MDVKTCWCEIFFNKFKGFRPSTGLNKRGGGVVETASTTNQSINHKPDHLHEYFEYSGTSVSMSMTGWPPVSNEQQRVWRERRMTGGRGGFLSHHHHYNNYYYYWCKEKCVVVCCGVHATVVSIPSYHYLFIIVITITIGHGVIILIVLGVAATYCG